MLLDRQAYIYKICRGHISCTMRIVVEDEEGKYKKHFIGISDNVTYVVEDITAGDVSKYKYTLNFNPKMWLPVEADTID